MAMMILTLKDGVTSDEIQKLKGVIEKFKRVKTVAVSVEHQMQPTSGTRPNFVHMANTLAWIIIDSASNGSVSSNDLDRANECLDQIIPYLNAGANP